jgi:hypothetical protein
MRKELFKVHYADYNLKIKADYITVEVFNSERDLKTLSLQHKRLVYLLVECLRNEEKMFHIYVGQTDSNGVRRPLSSIKEKEMNPDKIVILYTEKDTDFSMDQLRYIESKLIAFVKTHPLLKDRNGQASNLTVSDDDEVTCEKRLAELSKILYTLGFWFMGDWGLDEQTIQAKYALAETPQFPQVEEKTAVEVVESNSVNSEASFDFSQFPYFYIKNKKDHYTAQLKIKKKEFILLLGSKVRGWNLPSNDRKDRLKTLEKISKPVEGTKLLELTENLSCTSPSMAGQYVNGTTCAGWTEWKTADGETLEAVNTRLGNPLGRK